MVINIPLSIPDELLENTIAKDYESKITEKLTDEIRKILCNYDDSYYSWNTGRNPNRGMENWVSQKIDGIIKEYKPEIIEAASDKLAERLAKHKAAKELLNG